MEISDIEISTIDQQPCSGSAQLSHCDDELAVLGLEKAAIAKTALKKPAIEQRAKIFAALADPTRLHIVELLAQQKEMSGSEIAACVGISLALFCHHSKILAEAGIVQIRRDGQTKYSSLNQSLLMDCFNHFRQQCGG